MERLTINIPAGLSDEEKVALAEQLSQIAAQSVTRNQAELRNGDQSNESLLDLAGSLKNDIPAGTRAQERAAARQHIIDNATRDDA